MIPGSGAAVWPFVEAFTPLVENQLGAANDQVNISCMKTELVVRLGLGMMILSLTALPAHSAGRTIETLQVPVAGMTFTAQASGPLDGELVILLHGFPQTSHAYYKILPALAAAGFRAVAPDQRGYSSGARPAQVEAYRIGRLVEDVVGIADALGARRFHLVGHDWGGAVAWAVAVRQPERLRSLTVLSTPHPSAFAQARTEGDQVQRSSYMADLTSDGAEKSLLANDAAALRAILGPPISPADRDTYVSAIGSPEALRGPLNWYRALLSGPPAGAPPSKPRPLLVAPTLYVYGTKDAVFSPSAIRNSGRFVAGPYTLEEFEGAGHWLLESEPARIEALLLEHLTRWSTRGGVDGETLGNYQQAYALLEQALAAAGGRRAILGGFPAALRYKGFKLALGQSPTPDESPERLEVSGRFAVDAKSRVFMEQQLVNVGGTDRAFRRVIADSDGWNDWVPRQLLTELTAADASVMRGDDAQYPLRTLPHAVLAEASRHLSSLRWLGTRPQRESSVARLGYADDEGRLITLLVDAGSGRLLGLEHLAADLVRGDEVRQTRYLEPRRLDGLEVPGRVSFLRNGEEVENWTLTDPVIGQAVDVAVFDKPADREFTRYQPSFVPNKVADGVWMVRLYSGPANTYNTMLVEFDTFLAVMDAPLVDIFQRVITGIAAKLAPGKPIRYVLPTHAHFDHIGGIRGYLAAGVTAIATPKTAALLRRLAKAKLTVRPDPLAASGREPSIEVFEGRRVIREGGRELHLYDVGPSDHSQEIAIGYLPAERVLFVSDLFALPDNWKPLPPTATTKAFVARVEALQLDVRTVVAGHGLLATWDDVVRAER